MKRQTIIRLFITLPFITIIGQAQAKDIRFPDATYTFEGQEYIIDYKYSDKNQWRWADIRYVDVAMPNLTTPDNVEAASEADIKIIMQAEKALRVFLTEKTCVKGVLTQKVFDRYDHDYEFVPRRPMSVYIKEDIGKLALATSGQCHAVGGYPDHILTPKELKRKQKSEARAAKKKAKAEKKAAKSK